MKSVFKILLFAMAMTTFCVSTYAQKDNRQHMTREQLAETQAKYIAQEMAMNDTTAKKFVATFCQFQKEIWALAPDLREEFQAGRMRKQNKPLKSDSRIVKRY